MSSALFGLAALLADRCMLLMYWLMECSVWQASLGKKLLGLRVVNRDVQGVG